MTDIQRVRISQIAEKQSAIGEAVEAVRSEAHEASAQALVSREDRLRDLEAQVAPPKAENG